VGKFLLVIALFAAVVYATFWLIERRRAARSGRGRGRRTVNRPTPPRRAVAPDDDEEFLREIERRRRKAAREQAQKDSKKKHPEGKPERDQSSPE
jgi:hypothetical protein